MNGQASLTAATAVLGTPLRTVMAMFWWVSDALGTEAVCCVAEQCSPGGALGSELETVRTL